MKLHLLDATYELFRAFYGFPNRQAPDGREVGGIYGIIETTLSLLREDGVTHLGAATDTVIESFRNDLYVGYKSSEGLDPLVLAQFGMAERALEALGVVVWRMRDFEADDAIATAAARWRHDVEQVVIATPDKDLAQCVIGDQVVLYNRREQRFLDEDAVFEKYGVVPESIPDFLALKGDSADGIPGLPGWGDKSSSTLLTAYGHIEAIPDDPEEWSVAVRGKARLAETLAEHRQDALLFRTLTTLRIDVPLGEELSELEWKGVHRGPFESLCDELGFGGLASRPHRWATE